MLHMKGLFPYLMCDISLGSGRLDQSGRLTFSLWLEELLVPAMAPVMGESSGGGALRQHCTNPRSVGNIGGVYGVATNLVLRAAPPPLYIV